MSMITCTCLLLLMDIGCRTTWNFLTRRVYLPKAVTLFDFIKLGPDGTLQVCSSWHHISKDPSFYRSIDMRIPWDQASTSDLIIKLAKEAVDRSCGQLVELSCDDYTAEELLKYIIKEQIPLKTLKYEYFDLPTYTEVIDLIMIMKRLPSLEHLEMKWVGWRFGKYFVNYFDYATCAMAQDMQGMPQLRKLVLNATTITDGQLQYFLDVCPNLEYVRFRFGFDVNLRVLQQKHDSRIRDVWVEDTHDDSMSRIRDIVWVEDTHDDSMSHVVMQLVRDTRY